MKQTISSPSTVPTANIAVNKSRLKIYKNAGEMPTYYLQKGQEFSIELANPTTDVVMAKVILNGKAISQGGLVLNPGQRVYLERYLDVAKKFLFDTYEVSSSDEMKAAIADNGDLKVEFYRERQVYNNYYNGNGTITIGSNYPHNLNLGNYNSGTGIQYLRNSTSGLNLTGSITNCNTSTCANVHNASFTTSSASYSASAEPTLDSLSDTLNMKSAAPVKRELRTRRLAKQTIETGRVEKGSDSDQELKYVNKSFEYSAFHTIEYKMLPVSQKINTVEDINVKVYCTQCGSKIGKTDKFCASCGKKV